MMEARRKERERRQKAKAAAVDQLPSSRDEQFNLRLVDLYGKEQCLWNSSLPSHADTEAKREAWERITSKLGSHLNSSFVRSRVHSLRHHLNVYKLQMIEYRMTPGVGPEPEKPYFADRFAFLETGVQAGSSSDTEAARDTGSRGFSAAGSSDASGYRNRSVNYTLSRSQAQTSIRRSGPSIADMVKERLEADRQSPLPLHLPTPRMSVTQLQRRIFQERLRETRSSTSSSVGVAEEGATVSEFPRTLRAQPGDSVSTTKILSPEQKRRQQEKQEQAKEAESEDDELYQVHWQVRKQQRSLRTG
ncbi:hypothetical protein KR018_008370, partial [Drosophila ironensis]